MLENVTSALDIEERGVLDISQQLGRSFNTLGLFLTVLRARTDATLSLVGRYYQSAARSNCWKAALYSAIRLPSVDSMVRRPRIEGRKKYKKGLFTPVLEILNHLPSAES